MKRPVIPLREQRQPTWIVRYPWASLKVGDWFSPLDSISAATLRTMVIQQNRLRFPKVFAAKTTKNRWHIQRIR